MWAAYAVLFVAAVLTAGAAAWVLRAYRNAGGGAGSALPSLLACGAVGLIALGAYLVVGRPEIPDAPYAARLAALRVRDPTTYSPSEVLAVLADRAKQRPREALPHLYAGQVLMSEQRPQEAAREFDAALRRDPRLPDAMMGLGRALVALNENRVTPEALGLFQRAGALTNDPAPWIYQAMSAMQDGRAADTRALWGEALRHMTPDDPRRAMAQRFSTGQAAR